MEFSIHKKLGNFWIVEDEVTIAMCTQSVHAKRIRNALQKAESPEPTTNSASDAIALLDKLASFCERPEFGALDSITVASALRKAIARLRT